MIQPKVVVVRSRRIGFGSGHDGHPSLKCHPDGRVQANAFGKAREWETWRLHQIDEDRIALQAWTGKFLSAKPNGTIQADADEVKGWEIWTLKPGCSVGVGKDHASFVGLLSSFGKYLVCDDFYNCGDSVKANRNDLNVWEHWIIVDDPNAMTSHRQSIVYLRSRRSAFARDGHPSLKCLPDGRVQANKFGTALRWETWKVHQINANAFALQAWTGKFLSAKPGGSVRAGADEILGWEAWTLKTGEGRWVGLVSHSDKLLTCDNLFACGKSVRADRGEMKEWENWMIVDDPNAMTHPGDTVRLAMKGSVIAAGGILSAAAFAIPALGFGVGGVVANSAAAGIQSAVYGGVTGGVFSVLQSAGATMSWVPVAAAGSGAIATGAAMHRL